MRERSVLGFRPKRSAATSSPSTAQPTDSSVWSICWRSTSSSVAEAPVILENSGAPGFIFQIVWWKEEIGDLWLMDAALVK